MKYIILIVFIIPLFVKSQNVKKIELINADMIDYDEARYGKNVRRMVGNVTLKHENAILTCDSAFYNTEQNDVQMYGEVISILAIQFICMVNTLVIVETKKRQS
jgi:lipopolysaccharide assembly outer membrane protein LptD (OstA)